MKRSAQVMLVVMSATGVGAISHALTPRDECSQTPPGVAQPDSCRGSRGGSGGHYGSGSSWFSHGSSSWSGSASGSSSTALVGGTERGGFGSFAHAVAGHFSGGG
jgi:hypothetical protein